MRFHASLERARRTAKRLRDAVNHHRPSSVPIALTAAQRALAAAWGYADWAELALRCEDAPRSPFNVDAGPEVTRDRAAQQVAALSRVLGLPIALSCVVVATCGLTSRAPPVVMVEMAETLSSLDLAPPGRGKVAYVPGLGGVLLGSDPVTGLGLRLSWDDMRGHVAILGSGDHGASLRSVARQCHGAGTGLVLLDASGDASTVEAVLRDAVRLGRADQVQVLDLRELDAPSPWAGATYNPLMTGDAPCLSRLLAATCLPHDASPDLRRRVEGLLSCVSVVLVHRRDVDGVPIDAASVRDGMPLRSLVDHLDDESLPDPVREAVLAYVTALPGFDVTLRGRQAQPTLDWHGWVEMVASPALGELADLYGHVTATSCPSVDLGHVIRGCRTLLVLLPEARRARGRCHVGAFILAALARTLDGLSRAGRGPHAHAGVYPVILDEAAAYALPDMGGLARAAAAADVALVHVLGHRSLRANVGGAVLGGIVGSTATRVLTACGGEEAAAASFVASWPFPRGGAGVSGGGGPILDEGDVAALSPGEALVLRPGEPAVRVTLEA